MKTLIVTVMVALLLCNSAFAVPVPDSAVAPDDDREVSTSSANDAGRPSGWDLSNVPPHLRWLVIFAQMLTHKTVLAPDAPRG